MFTPDRACRVIIACVVLHNMAHQKNFYGENVNNFQFVEQIAIASGQALDRPARDIRANLLNNFNN